ncbi:MAG: S8 family serine peptidase [Hyphomicrobiaceae bacterium]|nr:S8 family serine peptidase [Hyphomicrobiaceae bacterium]
MRPGFVRLVIAMAVLLAGGLAPGDAGAADDKERLKQLLENKFKRPAARSARPASPTRSEDLIVIDKGGNLEEVKPRSGPAQPRSSLDGEPLGRRLAGRVLHAGTAGPARPHGDVVAAASAVNAGAGEQSAAITTPANALRLAQGEATVVNRRIIVIQLKPNTSDAAIDALIAKYNLDVVDAVPSLGALYVALPDAEAQRSGRSVRSLLEPNLVVRLRQEPVVNAAFVQTTIGPKTLPPPSGASAKQGAAVLTWNWRTGASDDGNWGLKRLRMPQVWSILSRVEEPARRARIALLDNGFGEHPQLAYANVKGGMPPRPQPADCARSHGTHIAGIIAARGAVAPGIDGIAPQAEIDAIPISRNLLLEGTLAGDEREQLHLSYFADVIRDLGEYFDDYPLAAGERRVVNVSLAYNWSWVRKLSESDPTADQSVRNQIQQHANFIQYLVDRVDDQVLFVVAAGNDSEGAPEPLNAKLATPFAFAALHETAYFKPSTNILVVEAHDRQGQLAVFSNTGGQISAPGVDVMSTIASTQTPFGVCSGTSQAAPHVAALAGLIFELDPSRTPAEVIALLRASAVAEPGSRAAPRVDALAAIDRLSDRYRRVLADLNGDGRVDEGDIAKFRDDMLVLEAARYGADINVDLNGDGRIDGNERCFPRIDLNGSGLASYDASDVRSLDGAPRSDLDMIRAAWGDELKTFDTALQASGLTDLIGIWQATSLVAAAPLPLADVPCNGR